MVNSEPTFKPWPDAPESFYILSDQDVSSARMGYLFLPGDPLPSEPFTLEDSWVKYSGCYVFFQPFATPEQQSNVPQFVSAAQRYIDIDGRRNTRFAWFENAASPGEGLFSPLLQVFPQPTSADASTDTLGATRVDFRNLSLLIGDGCPVRLNVEAGQFEITNGPNQQPPFHNIYLVANNLRQTIYFPTAAPPPPVAKELYILGSQLRIPISGEFQGTLQFDATADQSVLDDLRVGLQFYGAGCQQLLFSIPSSAPDFDEILNELVSGASDNGQYDKLVEVFGAHSFSLNQPTQTAHLATKRWWIQSKVEQNGGDLIYRYLLVKQGGGLDVYALGYVFDEHHKTPAPQSRRTEYPGQVSYQRYPVFDLNSAGAGETSLVLDTSLDPLNATDAGRTRFRLPANKKIPSYFLTNLGRRVDLFTAESSAPENQPQLIFANDPTTIVPDEVKDDACVTDESAYYLTVSGAFELIPSPPPTATQGGPMLMCGLSGIETIDIDAAQPGAGDILQFHPGQPAFAEQFRFGQPPDAGESNGKLKSGGAELTTAATTSWLSVSPNPKSPSSRQYWSQPENAPFYSLFAFTTFPADSAIIDDLNNQQVSAALKSAFASHEIDLPEDAVVTVEAVDKTWQIAKGWTSYLLKLNGANELSISTSNVLEFLELGAAPLPDSDSAIFPFPMTPLAGINTTDLANFHDLEMNVLAPVRRKTIFRHAPGKPQVSAPRRTLVAGETNGAGQVEQRGATPQGLLGQFDAQMRWNQITFALDSEGNTLHFKQAGQPIPDKLRESMQNSRLFMVISDPGTMQGVLSGNQIEIEKWQFQLEPNLWPQFQFGTVLIFKFSPRPLKELIEDSNLWAERDHFNKDPQSTSDDLREYFQKAIDDYNDGKGDKDLQYFVETVTQNAAWNGILAINVKVPLSGLPPEIEGLAAGIDPQKFYAHHLGINVSPLRTDAGKLTLKETSMFALINYTNDNPEPPPPWQQYAFTVKSLKVVFHNSEISNFASQVELTINQLFDQAVELRRDEDATDQPKNTITINGRYVTHKDQFGDEHHSYVFSEQGLSVFELPSQAPVLNRVGVFQIQFDTVVPKNGSVGQQDDKIEAKFQIWGKLDFAQVDSISGFDVFSFGAEPNTPVDEESDEFAGLSFTNLSIDMSFPVSSPNDATFAFNPSRITFDTSTSEVRKGSLSGHFPLKLVGLQSSASKKTPSQLGYAKVDTPLPPPSLEKTWYGLDFELKLGTLGDLAGKVDMTAKLLAAWSPNQNSLSALVGLSLPFASGNTIGIEGVLGLKFKQFQFVTDQSGGKVGYVLKFNRITLEFMKKSLPPGGTISAFIFGDPGAEGKNDTLGWYAAYAKSPPPPKPPKDDFGPPTLSATPNTGSPKLENKT